MSEHLDLEKQKQVTKHILQSSLGKKLTNLEFPETKEWETCLANGKTLQAVYGYAHFSEPEFCLLGSEIKLMSSELVPLYSKFSLAIHPKDNSKIIHQEALLLEARITEENDYEPLWVFDQGLVTKLTIQDQEYFLSVAQSIFEILDSNQMTQKVLSSGSDTKSEISKFRGFSIPTTASFSFADLFYVPQIEYKNHSVFFHSTELLHSESVNLGNRIGLCLSANFSLNENVFPVYYFIQFKDSDEVKKFRSSMLDIFGILMQEVTSLNTLRLEGFQYKIANIQKSSMAEISGKKLGILHVDFQIENSVFRAFQFFPENLVTGLLDKVSKPSLEGNPGFFREILSLNRIINIHKIRDLGSFSHPKEAKLPALPWEKILVLSDFINLLDKKDRLLLIQNFLCQNHSMDSLHEFFFFNVTDPKEGKSPLRKDPRFQEVEFVRYLPENFKKDWKDKKVKINKDDHHLKNIQIFHDIAESLKKDKLKLSARGVSLFFSGFYNFVLRESEIEFKNLMSFGEIKSTLESFPKKFVNDLVAQFTNKDLSLAFLTEKEAIAYFMESMSKTRKGEMAEEFLVFQRAEKRKAIDIQDRLEARKALNQKILTLKEEFV